MNSLLATLAVVGYFAGVESFPNNGGVRGSGGNNRGYSSGLGGFGTGGGYGGFGTGGGYGGYIGERGNVGSMYNNDISESQSAFFDLNDQYEQDSSLYDANELSELNLDNFFNGVFDTSTSARKANKYDDVYDERDFLNVEETKSVTKDKSSSGATSYTNESDFVETASGALVEDNSLSSTDASALIDSSTSEARELSDYSADVSELSSEVDTERIDDVSIGGAVVF